MTQEELQRQRDEACARVAEMLATQRKKEEEKKGD